MVIVDFQNCFIFVLLSLISILCYTLIFKKPEDGYGLPPSPPSLPIIGHLHLLFSALLHKSLQKVSRKYGPILRLRIFNFSVVLISSASLVYEIVKAQDVNVSTRNFISYEGSLFLGSFGFFTAPYGDYFKFMKKLIVTKVLGPQALDRSRDDRAHEVDTFYSNLLDKAMRKESIKILEEAMKLYNNIICKMVMGKSSSEETCEAQRVMNLMTESGSMLKKVFIVGILRGVLAKFGISLFKKDLEGISRNFDVVLEKILTDYKEKRDGLKQEDTYMMGVLLDASEDENAEYKITRNHIKSLLVELFIGAIDTSSHTTEWIMAEITNNPNILAKLREEIDSVVGKNRRIQEEDLPNLPYLQATVKEGLRLHPSATVIPRMFQEGCKVGGFYIPEKTRLLVNLYDIMRDPDLWEDPNDFKPERFLPSSRFGKEDDTREGVIKYLPFGFGRRGCPGSNLAYLFVGTAVGVMVQGFDWNIKGDMVNMEEARGTMPLSMAYPIECTLVPRTLYI